MDFVANIKKTIDQSQVKLLLDISLKITVANYY